MNFEPQGRPLVLAMGNDILGDDGVAQYAVRALKTAWHKWAHIEETSEAGLALLELMEGFDRALIVDSIMTGQHVPGAILKFSVDDFRRVIAPSPHYAGLPEVLALADRLGMALPVDIRILAMEVEDPFTVREGLTPCVEEALPRLIRQIEEILLSWRLSEICMSTH